MLSEDNSVRVYWLGGVELVFLKNTCMSLVGADWLEVNCAAMAKK